MTIEEMHYDVKFKLNKVDSQKYRNLLIPEIDWALNESAELFVKMVAMPRFDTPLGFEKTRRNIDDIRTVVVPNKALTLTKASNEYVAAFPADYWFFVKGKATLTKGSCSAIASIKDRQLDDDFDAAFYRSSFEWRELNATSDEEGLRLYTDGSFTVATASMFYIKRMAYMHNASNFRDGSYKLNAATTLTGQVQCELPEGVHKEVVDIAVLLISGQLQIPGYQQSFNKIKLNNLN